MSVFSDIEKFYKAYKGNKKIIGKSILGRPIYAMQSGKGCPLGIVQGAIHAREWITSYLILEQIRLGVDCGSAWFIPLANPDGALLSTCGIQTVKGEWRRRLLLNANDCSDDFSLWKANANAVDLNVNFDACWGTGTCNVKFPASANYVGVAPFSEPESRALRDFTLEVCPQYTISYHTMGEEIYWQFCQPFFRCMRDKKYACTLSHLTGYPLKSAEGSVGGYKDWCIQTLKIPAFTIEVGNGTHPLGKKDLEDILNKNVCTVREFSACWRRG
ncbi:MAG: hypothetical protein IKC91_01410 [Clostridia bacterium]|nr:hypothetical protein [Clostridia bacterium]